MSSASNAPAERSNQVLFWGCFIALITTSFAFIGRMFLIGTWETLFSLDKAEAGRLAGIGIWPFAVSIIGFSLVIDRIGYKMAMLFAFVGHMVWATMGVAAYYVAQEGTPESLKVAYNLVYWGSLVCALANGTVEAFINPVVATMFSREKTKWLNILHAGWPGGLVITGLFLIGIDYFAKETPWAVKIGLVAVPAVIYFFMLVRQKFPENERVSAGVSHRDMLREFGVSGAFIVGTLVVLQLMDFFSDNGSRTLTQTEKGIFIGIGAVLVIAFGAYTRSFGRGLLFILILIMIPLATTEIGTDGWITSIMESVFEMTPEKVQEAGGIDKVLVINNKPYSMHPGWVLVYTSAIMLVLRFFAGPIVHSLSPLGLLAASALLAILGLTYLSTAAGTAIFVAATLYGFGKTFFWPTMLGVVAEQCPKGGAFTLNAISGIGMLAVGTLGFPYIGVLQNDAQQAALAENKTITEKVPGLVEGGKLTTLTDKKIYEVIPYKTIDEAALNGLVTKPLRTEVEAKVQAQDTEFPVLNVVPLDTVMALLAAETPEDLDQRLASNDFLSAKAADAKLEVARLQAAVKSKEADVRQVAGDVKKVRDEGTQQALGKMAIFPAIMLVAYLVLVVYFKSKGGYQAEVLVGHSARDEKFTGGVPAAVE